jgi:hypothetical protein
MLLAVIKSFSKVSLFTSDNLIERGNNGRSDNNTNRRVNGDPRLDRREA